MKTITVDTSDVLVLIKDHFTFSKIMIETILDMKEEMQFSLCINRSDSLMKTTDFELTPSMLYVDNNIQMEPEEVVSMIASGTRITDFTTSGVSFCDSMYLNRPLSSRVYREYEIGYMDYFMISGANISGNRIASRFEPMLSELALLKEATARRSKIKVFYPFLGFSPVDKAIRMSEEVCSILDNAVLLFNKTKRAFRQKNVVDKASVSSFKSAYNFSVKGPVLTEEMVDSYFYTRHEVVVYRAMDMLGMDYTGSDESVGKFFDYSGLYSHLTPDIIYEEGPITHILEVSVANRDASDMLGKKKEKYEDMVGEIRSIFPNKEIKMSYLILDLTDPEESIIPDNLMMHHERIMMMAAEAMEVNNMMKDNPSYRKALEKWKNPLLDDEQEDAKSNLVSLMSKVLTKWCCNSETKAMDLSKSLELDNSNQMRKEEDFTKLEDDKVLIKIREKWDCFNEESTRENIKKGMKDIYLTGNLAPHIEMVMSNGASKVSEFMSSIISKCEEIQTREYDLKLPKVFKFPLWSLDEMDLFPTTPADSVAIGRLEDGTVFLNRTPELDDDEKEENRFGIGMDCFHDKTLFDRVMRDFKSSSSVSFQTMIMSKYSNDRVRSLCKFKVFEYCWLTSELYKEIALLEQRRYARDKRGGEDVMKSYEKLGVTIVIKRGSLLTKEKQIRFKVLSGGGFLNEEYLHSMKADNYGVLSTSWLTASADDIKHMVMLFEKGMAMTSNYMDAMEEDTQKPVKDYVKFMSSESVLMPLIILMEHKRGTSSICQDIRYVCHSMTAIISNKMEAASGILDGPIRSLVESRCRMYMLDWAKKLNDSFRIINSGIMKMQGRVSTDYDRIRLPNLFDPDLMVEFNWVMNDLYLGNLLQKTAGFSGHRSKAIMQKTAKLERNYLKVRGTKEAMGDMDIEGSTTANDVKQIFSMDSVFLAGSMLKKKLSKDKLAFNKSVYSALRSDVTDAMMITSSLKSGPFPSASMPMTPFVEKGYSFNTVFDKIKELGTAKLLTLCEASEIVEAFFSLFPKSQIGGPREILIQSIELRMKVKLLERVAERLCRLSEKEMITKGKMKHRLQSDILSEFKEEVVTTREKGDKGAFLFSLNADSSKWAQSFTMPCFISFLISLNLGKELEGMMLNVLRAFSHKIMYVPNSLKEKWAKKPEWEKEEEEDLEWLRSVYNHNFGTVLIFSGMGQGMLHYFSSLYHCAKDDMMDNLVAEVVDDLNINLEITTRTMLSSDDISKFSLIKFKEGEDIARFLVSYYSWFDYVARLVNIHVNVEKTALQIMLFEFNSYFSTGKRASMALIKDAYSMAEIVNLTEPDSAVNEVISNISRYFRNGGFMSTVEMMFCLMREWLIDAYKISKGTIKSICNALQVEESKIPSNLGFLRCEYHIEQMLYGKDFLMFEELGPRMKRYYRGLFTAIADDAVFSLEEMHETNCNISGKIRIKLPTRLDKKLMDMRKNFEEENFINTDREMDCIERFTLCVESGFNEVNKLYPFISTYLRSVHREYEFSDTAPLHSLIRAMSLSRSNASLLPKGIQDEPVDLVDFVELVLSRSSMNSSFDLLSVNKKLMDMAESNQNKLCKAVMSQSFRHQRMRDFSMHLIPSNEVCTSREVMEAMFMTNKDMSNRIMNAMTRLASVFDMSKEDIMLSPMSFIKKCFPNSKRQMTAFKMFLDHYTDSFKFSKIEVMTSKVDAGSVQNNLLNLWLDRKDPRGSYFLKEDTIRAPGNVEMDFLTTMTFCRDPDLIDMTSFIPENEAILPEDSSVMQAIKVINQCRKGGSMEDSYKVFYTRVMTKDRSEITHCFTTLNSVSTIVVNTRSLQAIIRVYSQSMDMEALRSLRLIMMRDLIRLRDSGMAIYFLGKEGVPSQDEFNIGCKIIQIDKEALISMKSSKWTLKLNLKMPSEGMTLLFSVFEDAYSYNRDSMYRLSLSDDMWIKVMEVESGEVSLGTLNRFLLDIGMKKETFFEVRMANVPDPKKTEVKKDMVEDYMNVVSMMSNLGINKVMETIGHIDDELDQDGLIESDNSELEGNMEGFEGMFGSKFNIMEDLSLVMENSRDYSFEDSSSVDIMERKTISGLLLKNLSMLLKDEIEIKPKSLLNAAEFCSMARNKNLTIYDIVLSDILMIMNDKGFESDEPLTKMVFMCMMSKMGNITGRMMVEDPRKIMGHRSPITMSAIMSMNDFARALGL